VQVNTSSFPDLQFSIVNPLVLGMIKSVTNFVQEGKIERPFSYSAQVHTSGHSLPFQRQAWIEQQKTVAAALSPYLEPEFVSNKDAAVRSAYRYIQNRLDQFDYKSAQEARLPIDSGAVAVEGGHRSVMKERHKIPGGWLKEDDVDHMLALRTLRANADWNQYWQAQESP
jgi:hypothetical protein